MIVSIAERMRASATAFREKVWPIIEPRLTGRIEMVEGRDDTETLAKILDLCGIDAFVCQGPGKAFGVASRTLNARKSRDCNGTLEVPTGFSIRHRRASGTQNVEYTRLKELFIESGELAYVHPFYHVQAVFLDRDVDPAPVYVALVKTKELIEFIDRHENDQTKVHSQKYGNAWFYEVTADNVRTECPSFWDDLKEPDGYQVGKRLNAAGSVYAHWLFDKDAVAIRNEITR